MADRVAGKPFLFALIVVAHVGCCLSLLDADAAGDEITPLLFDAASHAAPDQSTLDQSSEVKYAADATSISANAEEPWRLVSWNHYEGEWFSVRLGGVVMADVAGYSQDAASVQQVGQLSTVAQLRNFRLTLSGDLNFPQPWSY